MNPALNAIQPILRSCIHCRAKRAKRAKRAAKYMNPTLLNAHNSSHCRAKRAGSFSAWLKVALHSVVAPRTQFPGGMPH